MTRKKTNFKPGHFYIKKTDSAGIENFRDLSTMPGIEAAKFFNEAIANSRENERY